MNKVSKDNFTQEKYKYGFVTEIESEKIDAITILTKFHQTKLGAIKLDQIVWWDETHRKCLIGGIL